MINLGVSLSHKVGRTVIGSEDIWMHHLGGIPSHIRPAEEQPERSSSRITSEVERLDAFLLMTDESR